MIACFPNLRKLVLQTRGTLADGVGGVADAVAGLTVLDELGVYQWWYKNHYPHTPTFPTSWSHSMVVWSLSLRKLTLSSELEASRGVRRRLRLSRGPQRSNLEVLHLRVNIEGISIGDEPSAPSSPCDTQHHRHRAAKAAPRAARPRRGGHS
jgi:hypothetical protein